MSSECVQANSDAPVSAGGPRFCRLLEQLSTAAYACDREGRITAYNRQAAELWQRQPRLNDPTERYCGAVSLFTATGMPLEHDQSCVAEAIRENRDCDGERLVIGRPDGSQVDLRVHVQPQRDAVGNLAGAVVVLVDIAAERRAEERLKQAARTEAVGKLIAGLSHDFNNLLTVIGGCAEFALLTTEPQDPNRELLVDIATAIEKASLLTDQLLAVCKKQILQPRVVRIDDLVDRAGPLLRRVVGQPIEVLQGLAAPDCFVKVDPRQLEQILLTLAVHAQEVLPDGGALSIETRLASFSPADCPRGSEFKPGNFAALVVRLEGSGAPLPATAREQTSDDDAALPAPTHPVATHPAPTHPVATHPAPTRAVATRPVMGADLGLAVVRDFVRKSGGFISITRQTGGGTAFHLYLPACDHPAAPLLQEPSVAEQLGGAETVLVVEDDPAVKATICRSLSRHGYRVLQAGNGIEALCQVESDPSIRVVVSDIVMPRMSGHQLAAKLAALNPALKIIFMSGYSEDSVVCQITGESNVAFLQKPFSPGAVARSVRTLLDGDRAPAQALCAVS